jgi:hypothetical protein
MAEATNASFDSAHAQMQKSYDEAKDDQTKKMYKEMLDNYDKSRAEMKQNSAANISPAIAYNQQLLAKYDGALNAITNEVAKYEDKPGESRWTNCKRTSTRRSPTRRRIELRGLAAARCRLSVDCGADAPRWVDTGARRAIIEVEMGTAKLQTERQQQTEKQDRSVGHEPLTSRVWPKGYWQRWGKASRSLELVEPLPPGGKPTETQDP